LIFFIYKNNLKGNYLMSIEMAASRDVPSAVAVAEKHGNGKENVTIRKV